MPTLPGEFTVASSGLGQFYEYGRCAKYHGIDPITLLKMSSGEQTYLFSLYLAESQKSGVNAFDDHIKQQERERARKQR